MPWSENSIEAYQQRSPTSQDYHQIRGLGSEFAKRYLSDVICLQKEFQEGPPKLLLER